MMLDEIAGYLDPLVGTVYKATMADQPDSAVCLYEYAGPAPQILHDGQAWDNQRLQVVVRDRDYTVARQNAQVVYDALNTVRNTTLSGGNYLWIAALQSPFSLGPDSNQRQRVVTNYEVVRR